LALGGTCRAASGESPPHDTPKSHQKIDSETSGNNSRSARKNTAAVSARQTRSQITSCDARNGIFPPRSYVTERLHYCRNAHLHHLDVSVKRLDPLCKQGEPCPSATSACRSSAEALVLTLAVRGTRGTRWAPDLSCSWWHCGRR